MNVLIRSAEPQDAEVMRAIYNHAVLHTTATMDVEERCAEQQAAWMAAHTGAPYPALVALDSTGGSVVGYASLSPFNLKPGYARTVENSIYVAPDSQRQGVGERLLSALIVEAMQRGFVSIIALISADNETSLRLHRRHEFADAGRMRRVAYKHGQWIDVLYLQHHLQPPRDAGEQGVAHKTI